MGVVVRAKTIVSIKDGDTATDRRALSIAAASVPNADPSASTDGWILPNCDWLHVYAKFSGGGTSATVRPWYYAAISDTWNQGEDIAFTTTDTLALVQVENEYRVYFKVSALNAGTLELWAGGPNDE